MRVLVIEDDPQFRLIIRRLLETEATAVEIAASAREAFEKLHSAPYDAILMDLVLGDDSALNVLRSLNAEGITTPVIVMTAHGSIETVSEAMRLNAFDYITKPFSVASIMQILHNAVDGRQPADASHAQPPDATAAAATADFFDNVNDIVYTRDMDGIITSINFAGERFFGTPRHTLIGKSLHGLFSDELLEDNLKATNQKLLQEGADRSIVQIQDATGRLRMLESNVSLVRDANHNAVGARGIMRDVTEAKELEVFLREQMTELEEANEKLKEFNRIKTDFTAMLAHDLKAPTASMIMALEYLLTAMKDAPESDRRMIEAGLAAGRNMIGIVEDMLELFKSDSTRMELNKTPVEIGDLVQDALREAQIPASRQGISLEPKIPDGLPKVAVDRQKMNRVFSNLLCNALKFTTAGGRIVVEARRAEGDGFVEILVCDNGEGIAPEHLSYIFDPYWRASQKRGTGLGLAIVKRIVSAHGGSVAVQSKPGNGSEFSVRLPI
jgi:PAS domain S-box-containing protein